MVQAPHSRWGGREGNRHADSRGALGLAFQEGPRRAAMPEIPARSRAVDLGCQVRLGQSLRQPVAPDNVREKPHFPEKGLEVN